MRDYMEATSACWDVPPARSKGRNHGTYLNKNVIPLLAQSPT